MWCVLETTLQHIYFYKLIFLNKHLISTVGKVWLEILVANLANLVAVAPVLGAILCPEKIEVTGPIGLEWKFYV